jgi:hypothetical protein
MGGGDPMAVEPVYSEAEIEAVLRAYGRMIAWLMERQHHHRFRLEAQGLTTELIVGLHTYIRDVHGKLTASGNPWVWLPAFEDLPLYVQEGYTGNRYAIDNRGKRRGLAADLPMAVPEGENGEGMMWSGPGLYAAPGSATSALYAPLPLSE